MKNLHERREDECVNGQNGDAEVPNEAECSLAVNQIPLDVLTSVLLLRVLLILFVDLVNDVVPQHLVQLLLLPGLLSQLLVETSSYFPKVLHSCLWDLLGVS